MKLDVARMKSSDVDQASNGNSLGTWFSYQVSSSNDDEITINNNPGNSGWNKLFNADLGSSATSLEFELWSQ